MAYSNTAKAVPCALSSCRRTVRPGPNSPNFPYCVYHGSLKNPQPNSLSNLVKSNMTAARELLYNPKFTFIKPRAMVADIVSQCTPLSKKEITKINSLWLRTTRGVNMFNPEKAFEMRDDLLASFGEHLMKTYGNKQVLECFNSSVSLPSKLGGVHELRGNHKVLSFLLPDEDEDMNSTMILDPAPASQLRGIITGDIRDTMKRNTSSLTDGVYISSLYEFSQYSAVDYGFIKNEKGETIWDNNVSLGSDTPDVQYQRDILSHSAPQSFSPPVFRRSPTDEDLYGSADKSTPKDDLDSLFDG